MPSELLLIIHNEFVGLFSVNSVCCSVDESKACWTGSITSGRIRDLSFQSYCGECFPPPLSCLSGPSLDCPFLNIPMPGWSASKDLEENVEFGW